MTDYQAQYPIEDLPYPHHVVVLNERLHVVDNAAATGKTICGTSHEGHEPTHKHDLSKARVFTKGLCQRCKVIWDKKHDPYQTLDYPPYNEGNEG